MVPWCYQNLTAFAPEPPYRGYSFVYRVKRVGEPWSNWRYPAFGYLYDQWNNRFSISTKTHDQLENIGEYLYTSALRGKTTQIIPAQDHVPIMNACRRFVQFQTADSTADTIQVAVYHTYFEVDKDELSILDSAYIFSPIALDL